MFLIVFVAVFGNDPIDGFRITVAQFYAPALAVFAAASATYTNLAVSTAITRDLGILKRIRGTPLPPWIYITGRVGSAIWLALLAVVMMTAVCVLVYNLEIIGRTLPAAIISFVVGVSCFAALGMMVAALVSNGDSAPAVANFTLLPLAFVSNVFLVPADDPPVWIDLVGDLFPLKHFTQSFGDAFNPFLEGSGFAWTASEGEYAIGIHLAVMAAWGIGAIVVALRFFKWEPSGEGGRRSRRSRRRAAVAEEA